MFRKDWNSSYRRFASTSDGWLDFYLAYLLWASRMIRTAYPGFMEHFAEWFIETVADVGQDANDFRAELQVSYSTAFEFIIIGATYLEGAGGPCLCW